MRKFNDLQDLDEIYSDAEFVDEPFDPDYLSSNSYQIPDISSYEKAFYRKMNIVINKLRRNHIKFEWLEDDEVFRVEKFRYKEVSNIRRKDGSLWHPTKEYSKYPTYMYISIYDNKEYAFGGEETDLIVSTRISEVIAEVVEWLNNNEPAVR